MSLCSFLLPFSSTCIHKKNQLHFCEIIFSKQVNSSTFLKKMEYHVCHPDLKHFEMFVCGVIFLLLRDQSFAIPATRLVQSQWKPFLFSRFFQHIFISLYLTAKKKENKKSMQFTFLCLPCLVRNRYVLSSYITEIRLYKICTSLLMNSFRLYFLQYLSMTI